MAAAATPPVERLPQLILFLVNPLLLLPFVTDQALLRWLLVAASLAVALLASGALGARMWRHRAEVWPLAALTLLLIVHLARGAPVAETVRWLVLIVLGGVTYLYCRTLGSSGRDTSLRLLVMAGGAIGAYAVLQAVGLDVVPYSAESWMYRVVTTFGHRNFTATFLVVVLFCALQLHQDRGNSPGRWPLISTVLIYLGLLATGSRFPILAATVALAMHFGIKKTMRWVAVVLMLVLAIWTAVIFARGELGAVVTRTETLFLRADLYRSMTPLMVAEPVVGLGPGGFARGVGEVIGPRMPEDTPGLVFLHAHLLPAELVIDLGVIGLVFALCFVLPAWMGLVRRRRLGWLGWAHLVWLVINLYDVSFFSYAGWVTLWPLLAFLRTEGPLPAAEAPAPGWFGRGLLIVLMVGAVFVLAPMVRSSHYSFLGATALVSDRGPAAVSAYERADDIWSLPLEDRYRQAVATLKAGEAVLATQRLLAVESEAPGFSAVRYNLAMAYARLEQESEAAVWNDRHLDLHPRDQGALDARERFHEITDGAQERDSEDNKGPG